MIEKAKSERAKSVTALAEATAREPAKGAGERRYAGLVQKLRSAGLRPTRQRLALANLLFANGDRHVCAETLYEDARAANIRVSLATIYNTLHQFTAAGLLREVAVAPGRFYFDTNAANHHHFYFEDSGVLEDIPGDQVIVQELPAPPADRMIARIDIIVRLVPNK